MKIINLKTENFKKIKAVDITPEDNTIVITGKNGQGKTSLLDSIFVALTGKNKDLKKPVREGEDKASIEVDMDDYKVIRTFTSKTNNLKVVNKDGSIWPKPQAMLDEIVGKLSFDPLSFIRKSEKEQRDILLDLAGVDLESLNEEREKLYNKRHEAGLEGKAMTVYSDKDVIWATKYEKEEIPDLDNLKKEIEKEKSNKEKYYYLEKDIENLSIRQKELEEELEKVKQNKEEKEKELGKIDFMEENLKRAEGDYNKAVEKESNIKKAKEILESNKRVSKKREEYNKYDKDLKELDLKKEDLLGNATMPIEGLEITDEGVLYSGIPLSQVSSSEQIKVGVAISMAMNPELRVIRIDDGSLLDKDNLKAIQDTVKEKDYQVWIESVDNKDMGFYIEDGEIKNK